MKHWGKARTSRVSCERTFFATFREIEEVITVVVKWSGVVRLGDEFIHIHIRPLKLSGDHPVD